MPSMMIAPEHMEFVAEQAKKREIKQEEALDVIIRAGTHRIKATENLYKRKKGLMKPYVKPAKKERKPRVAKPRAPKAPKAKKERASSKGKKAKKERRPEETTTTPTPAAPKPEAPKVEAPTAPAADLLD